MASAASPPVTHRDVSRGPRTEGLYLQHGLPASGPSLARALPAAGLVGVAGWAGVGSLQPTSSAVALGKRLALTVLLLGGTVSPEHGGTEWLSRGPWARLACSSVPSLSPTGCAWTLGQPREGLSGPELAGRPGHVGRAGEEAGPEHAPRALPPAGPQRGPLSLFRGRGLRAWSRARWPIFGLVPQLTGQQPGPGAWEAGRGSGFASLRWLHPCLACPKLGAARGPGSPSPWRACPSCGWAAGQADKMAVALPGTAGCGSWR